MRLISFDLSGDFAEFSDPSVTTNQIVYFIPSKTAVIGIIGAILGIKRKNTGPAKWYNDDFLDLLYETEIGIKLLSEPTKFIYYSNNVSLKETKKKPYKRELLIEPKFKIFLTSSNEYLDKIIKVIKNRKFGFSPFLGHVYCHARIENLKVHKDVKKILTGRGKVTSCVVLDEGESYNENFVCILEPVKESRIIIERHLHHFGIDDKKQSGKQTSKLLQMRVLKHWIPVGGSEFKIIADDKREISKFVNVGGSIVCLY